MRAPAVEVRLFAARVSQRGGALISKILLIAGWLADV